jgi:hypothetical protein
MAIYTAVVSQVAVTVTQDVFEIVCPATASVLIHDIKLGQYTDFGDAAAEILSVQVIRGFTTTGSGGAAVTPVPTQSWNPVSTCTVARNNTTLAQNGTGSIVISDTFNIAAGWSLRDVLSLPNRDNYPKNGIWLDASERLVVRITAPADSITMNATLTFEECAKRILS